MIYLFSTTICSISVAVALSGTPTISTLGCMILETWMRESEWQGETESERETARDRERESIRDHIRVAEGERWSKLESHWQSNSVRLEIEKVGGMDISSSSSNSVPKNPCPYPSKFASYAKRHSPTHLCVLHIEHCFYHSALSCIDAGNRPLRFFHN